MLTFLCIGVAISALEMLWLADVSLFVGCKDSIKTAKVEAILNPRNFKILGMTTVI